MQFEQVAGQGVCHREIKVWAAEKLNRATDDLDEACLLTCMTSFPIGQLPVTAPRQD